MTYPNEAVERLKAECAYARKRGEGSRFHADILAVCAYAEAASKVVEAAKALKLDARNNDYVAIEERVLAERIAAMEAK